MGFRQSLIQMATAFKAFSVSPRAHYKFTLHRLCFTTSEGADYTPVSTIRDCVINSYTGLHIKMRENNVQGEKNVYNSNIKNKKET